MLHTTFALLTALGGFGDLVIVDDDAALDPGPNDPSVSDPLEDGSPAHPFDGLAEAIAAASGFSPVVRVEPGYYAGPENGGIVVGKQLLTILGARGADETVFDLEHQRSFLTVNGVTAFLSVEGLTVVNGSGSSTGAIETLSTSTELWVTECSFHDNHATGTGPAGGALTVRGRLECANNAFLSNSSAGNGGAVAIANDSTGSLAHKLLFSTFADNVAAGDGGAVWAQGSATASLQRTAIDCIFWGNQALVGGADQIGEELPGNFYVSECDVEGGWPFAGTTIFDVDPLFAVQRDPHLSTASPLQDIATGLFAGYPCTAWPWDVDGQLRSCGVSDLGADELEPVTLALGLPTDAQRAVGICGAPPSSPLTLIVSSGHRRQPARHALSERWRSWPRERCWSRSRLPTPRA
jgi:hypothetical protein